MRFSARNWPHAGNRRGRAGKKLGRISGNERKTSPVRVTSQSGDTACSSSWWPWHVLRWLRYEPCTFLQVELGPATIRHWISLRKTLEVLKVDRCVLCTGHSVLRYIGINKIQAMEK